MPFQQCTIKGLESCDYCSYILKSVNLSVPERGMRRFKSMQQAQRFLGAHATLYNLFNLGRHLVSAKHYRIFRDHALASWKYAVAL